MKPLHHMLLLGGSTLELRRRVAGRGQGGKRCSRHRRCIEKFSQLLYLLLFDCHLLLHHGLLLSVHVNAHGHADIRCDTARLIREAVTIGQRSVKIFEAGTDSASSQLNVHDEGLAIEHIDDAVDRINKLVDDGVHARCQ